MTLTTRLTVFFLAALALLLAGFSFTLYWLARTSWQHRINDRLQGSLNVLATASENDGHGLEWEGRERLNFPENDPDIGPIGWIVADGHGGIIDHSRQGEGLLWQDNRTRQLTDTDAQQWAIARGGLQIKEADAPGGAGVSPGRYATLEMTAALPLRPMQTALRQLAAMLAGVALAVWLLAAIASRWLCRRALMPVRRMALAARGMGAADLDQRLPVVPTGDELHELGQAFNDLLSRLQESYERQARFSGDASHQLRTPLTSLLGQIEIALRRPRSPEEYQQVLTVLHDQAVRMRQIVETLLFLARADAEAKAPHLEPLDLRAWLGEHLASWAGHVRAAAFRVESGGSGPRWVQAQTALLGQLLDTLLDNACKYSAPGTAITISLAAEADAVCLTVTDTGCGIAATDLPHLFEPFYRSPQARQQGVAGLGLGLTVAQRIAVALGGALQARSQPGEGSSFTLRLPIPVITAAPAPHRPRSLMQALVVVLGLSTALALGPVRAQAAVHPLDFIDTGFENASPLWYEIGDDGAIFVHLLYDHERGSPNRAAGHFHFQLQARAGSKLTLEFKNLDNVWNGRKASVAPELGAAVISQDGRRWRSVRLDRLPGNRVRLTVEMPGPRLYVARVEPYRLSDLDRLLTTARKSSQARITTIGKTAEGRPLEVLQVGSTDAPYRVFVRARAHPWEAGGNWVVEGLVRRLLKGDATAETFLRRYCLYVMPMANKDGVARGRTRFNVRGKDLNRNWDKPADPHLAPENAALEAWLEEMVRAGRPPHLAIDLHNDGRGLLHVSRPPVRHLQRHVERMATLEALLRKHTWFTEGSTQEGFRNAGTLGEGWLQRYGIDAVIHELNCSWIEGLKEAPLGRHWETYGEQLATVFHEYFGGVRP